MRRSDREITDWQDTLAIIESCDVCRLGLNDNGRIYIVPMNFGFLTEDGHMTLYFHCAHEGRKLDILRVHPQVGFEMDCDHQLFPGNEACQYGMRYASVIGEGLMTIVETDVEKRDGLAAIMKKYAPERTFTFDQAALDYVTVLRLDVSEWSAKRRA